MSTLIDTNVIGELARKRPEPKIVAWAGELETAILSVITMEEIFFGLAKKPNPRIERWFERFLESSCRLLDVTVPIARHAGILRGQLARKGQTRSQTDMLIAATAAIHGLTLATRNVRDFDGCGISVIDPLG